MGDLDLLEDEPQCETVPQSPIPKPLWLKVGPGLTHQCLYFEQPHTFEQILFIQTAEPALVGHAQIT